MGGGGCDRHPRLPPVSAPGYSQCFGNGSRWIRVFSLIRIQLFPDRIRIFGRFGFRLRKKSLIRILEKKPGSGTLVTAITALFLPESKRVDVTTAGMAGTVEPFAIPPDVWRLGGCSGRGAAGRSSRLLVPLLSAWWWWQAGAPPGFVVIRWPMVLMLAFGLLRSNIA